MAEQDDLQTLGRRLLEQKEGTAEREAYLEDLARRVRSGEYRVDSDELAARILDHLTGEQ